MAFIFNSALAKWTKGEIGLPQPIALLLALQLLFFLSDNSSTVLHAIALDTILSENSCDWQLYINPY